MPFSRGDAYKWQAVFSDDTLLAEDDSGPCFRHPDFPEGHAGEPHAFACINKPDLIALALEPQKKGFRRIVQEIPEGARLVFVRRRGTHMNLTTGETVKGDITVIGWQMTVGATQDGKLLSKPRNIQSVMFVLEDGTVINSERFNAFGPSAPKEWEKQR